MLPAQSRVYRPEGGWTEEANKCGAAVREALKYIAKEFEDTFSPDEFEDITLSELTTLVSIIRIEDNTSRRRGRNANT